MYGYHSPHNYNRFQPPHRTGTWPHATPQGLAGGHFRWVNDASGCYRVFVPAEGMGHHHAGMGSPHEFYPPGFNPMSQFRGTDPRVHPHGFGAHPHYGRIGGQAPPFGRATTEAHNYFADQDDDDWEGSVEGPARSDSGFGGSAAQPEPNRGRSSERPQQQARRDKSNSSSSSSSSSSAPSTGAGARRADAPQQDRGQGNAPPFSPWGPAGVPGVPRFEHGRWVIPPYGQPLFGPGGPAHGFNPFVHQGGHAHRHNHFASPFAQPGRAHGPFPFGHPGDRPYGANPFGHQGGRAYGPPPFDPFGGNYADDDDQEPGQKPDDDDQEPGQKPDAVPALNPYTVLEANPSDSEAEITKKWRKMSLKCHPDRETDPQKKERATLKMAEINVAYDILKDPKKRQYFDRTGKVKAEI